MNFCTENRFNFSSLNELVGRNTNSSFFIGTSQYLMVTSKHSAWPNFIYNIEFEKYKESLLDNLSDGIDKFDVKPVIFSIDNPLLDTFLKDNGYLPVDLWEGMYRPISTEEVFEISTVNEVGIVESEEELHEWLELVSSELFHGKKLARDIFIFLKGYGSSLIYQKVAGRIVSTSMIYTDPKGISGIYMVCVSKAYRGKGYGKNILNYSLSDIKKKNKNIAVLQSTRLGLHLYKSLGFCQSNKYTLFMKLK